MFKMDFHCFIVLLEKLDNNSLKMFRIIIYLSEYYLLLKIEYV